MDLRKQSLEDLLELGSKYVALGGLVPFFNKNHNIEFIGKVILQARKISPDIPLHLYGGGDPLELFFYIALGCDIFDSSSFIHYACDGWYMTPYGALQGEKRTKDSGFSCECPYCRKDWDSLWENKKILAAHNLWTILDSVKKATRLGQEGIWDYLEDRKSVV